jgi:lipopolysaccharide transport system permease protein
LSIAIGQVVQHAPGVVAAESTSLLRTMWRERKTLWAVAWLDFQKKYAGSFLGLLWLPLYSLLFMGMYSFTFIFIWNTQVAGFTTFQYVVFFFTGLVPYFLVVDVIASSVTMVKSNIAIIKTTLFPTELLPVKQVIQSLLAGAMNIALVVVMAECSKKFHGLHMLYLPVPLVLATLACLALGWFFSMVGVMFPDISQFINVLTLAILFLSPISTQLDQMHGFAKWLMLANPMSYLIDSFRFAVLGKRYMPMWSDALALLILLLLAGFMGTLFRRLKPMFVDYE